MEEPGPLDEAQRSTLAQTRRVRRKLRFASFIAASNVWGLGVCAVFSLAFGLFELSLSPIGLALGALAWNEEQGRRQLHAADVRAPRRLALNQLALFAVVLVYCAYGAHAAWTGPSAVDALLGGHPELPDLLGDASGSSPSVDEMSQWGRKIVLFTYGAIAVGSGLVQGLTAWYYSSLRPTVEALAATPRWARELSE